MSISELERAEIKKEIDEANDLVWNLRSAPREGFNPENLITKAHAQSREINYPLGEGRSLLNMGMGAFILNHDYPLSEKYINKAIEIFQNIEDIKWEANGYLTQAIIKNSTGKPETALYLGLKGFEFYQNNPTHDDHVMASYVIGTIYKDLGKLAEAEKYFTNGISYDKEYNSWNARLYTGLSNILIERQDYHRALEMGEKGLELLRYEKNEIGMSRALNDLGAIYFRLKNYDKALEHIFEALKLRKQNNVKHFVLGSLIDVAGVYFEMKKFDEALTYYIEAEPIAIDTNHNGRLSIIYNRTAEIYKYQNQYEKSLATYEKLIKVLNEIAASEKELKVSQSESKLVKEKEEEIERLRNVELKNAYDLIAEKNKEINDSINYAQRLQRTLMANDDLLAKNLKEYFIYFNPKEAVSGDFYWASYVKTADAKDGKYFVLVCADSTGHGVPGAIMSMMNMNSLKEVVKAGHSEADDIFNQTRATIIKTLANDGSAEGGKDGMDASLVIFNSDFTKVDFALANNPLWLIRNKELIEFKADKMPIGKHDNQAIPFTKHSLDLQKGDLIYLLTDGYADQFGGEDGKKFKSKSLKNLLESIAHLPMYEQEKNLDTTFETWRGSLEQIDDVCIIGVRV